jgi:hypothetical protein
MGNESLSTRIIFGVLLKHPEARFSVMIFIANRKNDQNLLSMDEKMKEFKKLLKMIEK